jgi:hypothetical protein
MKAATQSIQESGIQLRSNVDSMNASFVLSEVAQTYERVLDQINMAQVKSTAYYQDRNHLGLRKDAPRGRLVEPKPVGSAKMIARRRVGGLHHRYDWEQAA